MAAQVSKKLAEFANEVYPAIIGTTRTDGSVEMVPVWFEQKDGSFWINGATTRGWFKHMQRDPRITLMLVDPKNMWRWAQVEGKMVEWAEDPNGEHINHLSHRYLKTDYQNARTGRIKIQIEPTRITGSIDGRD
ncbi:MAG: pyridoxamine 5'-phosphate oxidase family protein [Candidatus Dormibacteraeota bacterium]|nr:pyridoxamine 5'-phosphate oxidase family protein [Candidatus Dormibacteraeota bacterium]